MNADTSLIAERVVDVTNMILLSKLLIVQPKSR